MLALGAVVISLGTNLGLYTHLSSVMNSRFDSWDRKMDGKFDRIDGRFDSVERRLELMQGDRHNLDLRLATIEK